MSQKQPSTPPEAGSRPPAPPAPPHAIARDDVKNWMEEAGAGPHDPMPQGYDGFVSVFARFAGLVADAEREKVAKQRDELADLLLRWASDPDAYPADHMLTLDTRAALDAVAKSKGGAPRISPEQFAERFASDRPSIIPVESDGGDAD